MDRRFLRVTAAALLVALSAACAPVRTYSGFSGGDNDAPIADPQVGVDTRTTIEQRFGTPSTTAVFDQTAWYYVSSVQEQVAFYSPRVTERRVMVVHFEGDTVASVDKYGVERGRIIAYNTEETPTRGRELGVLEQLFGNVGATPLPNQEEDEGGPRRRD